MFKTKYIGVLCLSLVIVSLGYATNGLTVAPPATGAVNSNLTDNPASPATGALNSNLTDNQTSPVDPSNISVCNNLKEQMLSQPNHVHAQIRIDTAYSKNCQQLDPLFWQLYWPTSIQSDINKKAEACKSLNVTDEVYIKYHCDMGQANNLSIRDIQICERLKSQLQSQADLHRNSRIDYAKNLKCHIIDRDFWTNLYTP